MMKAPKNGVLIRISGVGTIEDLQIGLHGC